MEENTEQRVDLTLFSEKIQELKDRIASVIVGQEQTVDLILTAILANGHVLIEGVPGVAKTLLARLTARLIDADFSRVQFTPDLMPSDVLGTTVFNMKTNGFDFHQGPIFADIVLVDEINRAPAKTQAALFEVMEERQISIDGTTHRMGDLYTILATQNPVEQEGTYKLPEAQLDRFLMKISFIGRGSEYSGTSSYQCRIGEVGRHHSRYYQRRTVVASCFHESSIRRPHVAPIYRIDCTADPYQQSCIFGSFSTCICSHAAIVESVCSFAGT
jgi:hypothetical protein